MCSVAEELQVLLKLLLEQEVDINSRDSQGATPLHLASLKDIFELYEHFLEYGAKINPRKLTSYSRRYILPALPRIVLKLWSISVNNAKISWMK